MTTVNKTRSQLFKRGFLELMKDVGTSIPGYFLSFDPDTQLAQIQIGVQSVENNGTTFEPSPLIECPVAFFGGSEYFIEHQIDPGDECLVIFSQRCIDGWVNTGGVADNPIMRFHNVNDACILPGLRSQPNKIDSFQNNGVRLRNKAGDKYVWLKNDGTADITVDTLNINANVVHNGNTEQTGNLERTGTTTLTGNTTQTGDHDVTNVTATGTVGGATVAAVTSLTVAGVEQAAHDHGGVERGTGRTDPAGT